MNTSNAIIPVGNSENIGKKRNRAPKRQPRETWTKPVSKKFYNHLIDKVSGILDTLRAPWVMEQIRTFIDNYLTSREINSSLDLYNPKNEM